MSELFPAVITPQRMYYRPVQALPNSQDMSECFALYKNDSEPAKIDLEYFHS